MSIQKEAKRYVIVTPLIGLTDMGLYYLFNTFMPYTMAKAVSYLIANIGGYIANKYWTFCRTEPSTPEAAKYFGVEVLLFAFNVITNHFLRMAWPNAVLRSVLTASILTAVLSFLAKKYCVFKTA